MTEEIYIKLQPQVFTHLHPMYFLCPWLCPLLPFVHLIGLRQDCPEKETMECTFLQYEQNVNVSYLPNLSLEQEHPVTQDEITKFILP